MEKTEQKVFTFSNRYNGDYRGACAMCEHRDSDECDHTCVGYAAGTDEVADLITDSVRGMLGIR